MNLAIIFFTSVLAAVSAGAFFWFSIDFLYRLRYTLAQRSRAKKAAQKEAEKEEKKKDR